MSQHSRWLSPRRILIAVPIAFLIVVGAAFAAVQVDQYMFRRRAERLYRDVTTLQFRETTFAEFEPIRNRWLAESMDRSACAEQRCDFTVILLHGFGPVSRLPVSHPSLFDYVWTESARIFAFLGGRDAYVDASFYVRNGHVWSASYEAQLLQPGRNLISGFTVVGTSCAFWNEYIWSDAPCLYTDVGNSLMPFRGKNDITARISISPYAAAADFGHWTAMDLSCITRWNECESVAELGPGMAAAHAEIDMAQPLPPSFQRDVGNCPDSLVRFYARNARSAAIFEITGRGPDSVGSTVHPLVVLWPTDTGSMQPASSLRVRMVQPLKRADNWAVGKEGWLVGPIVEDGRADLRPGNRWIVMYQPNEARESVNIAETAPCAMTRERKYEILAPALREDTRIEPLDAYESLPKN